MNSDKYQSSFNSSFHSYLAGNTPSFELGRHESEFRNALNQYIDTVDIANDEFEKSKLEQYSRRVRCN